MQTKKVIAFDLDGTLLNKKGELSRETVAYVEELKKNGHMIILSTGRPYRGMAHFYQQLKLNTPIVNDNGGITHHPNDHQFPQLKQTIPVKVCKDIFQHFKAFTATAFYSVDNTVYVYNRSPRIENLLHIEEHTLVFEGPLDEISQEAPFGIIYVIHVEHKDTFESYLSQAYPDLLSFRLWGEDQKHAIYEVYQKNISKASGLDYILRYYNLKQSDLIAFGDGTNDHEMLAFAHLGVAMLNAKDELKALANDVTSLDNDDNGVIEYLKSYFKA